MIRLPLLFDYMLGMLERGITLIVFVDAILTMPRENFHQFVKFAAIHLRLEIGQGIFVSEQGQKFHLTRYCSTFKNLQATEYSKCTACGTPGDSMRDSVLRQRRAASSSGMPEYLSPSAAEDG